MITTSALCAHLEGTFEARYNIAKDNYNRNQNDENYFRLQEAAKAYDTVYAIIYEFEESNSAIDNDYTSC